MDFYIWKYWVATSGEYQEGMKDKIMNPYTRYFVITVGINWCTHIHINDLYCDGCTFQETDKACLHHQIKWLQKILQKLEEEYAVDEEDGGQEEDVQNEYVQFSTCFNSL